VSHQHDVTLKLGQAASHNPGKFKLYRRYADTIWNSAAIDASTTEIIAVGSTHITRCSYCVDFHASRAKSLGVSGAQLIEAGVIAAALRALEITTLGGEASGFPDHAPDPFLDLPFNDDVTALDLTTKALVVLAASYELRNAPLVREALRVARERGIAETQLREAQQIAIALASGATIRHLAEVADVYAD
jgi:AhpD family alkylhydroperoxidase